MHQEGDECPVCGTLYEHAWQITCERCGFTEGEDEHGCEETEGLESL